MASLVDPRTNASIANASSFELHSAVKAIAHASSDAYTEWARRTLNLAVHDSYRLSGGGGDDRGVVAARAIDASPSQPVELVVVPFDAMLHATAALVCNSQAEAAAAQAFAAIADKLTREDDVLACRLLFERHLGDRSRWYEHVRRLPDMPDHCVLRWNDAELAELSGSDVRLMATRWREQVASDFEEIVAAAAAAGPLARRVGSSEAFPWLDADAYRWAVSMVFSRAIPVRRGADSIKVLVPVVDMFNHDPAAPTTHAFDAARDALIVRREAPAAAGAALAIVYEHATASRLLLLCGFVPPLAQTQHAGRDVFAGLAPDAPHRAEKLAILAGFGVKAQAAGEAPFVVSEADPLPDALALTLYAQRCDLDALGRLVADRADRDAATARAGLADLVAACDVMLRGYPSGEAEDLAALADGGLAPRRRLALLVRVSERRALAACRREAAARRAAVADVD